MKITKKSAVTIVTIVSLFLVTQFPANARTKVCFCHNVNNNPHTICTANQAKINGHTSHVNNGTDASGACILPTLTSCPTPTIVIIPTLFPTPTTYIIPTTFPTPTTFVFPTSFPTPTHFPTPTRTAGDENNGNIDICITPRLCLTPTQIPSVTTVTEPTQTPTQAVTASVTEAPTSTPAPATGGTNVETSSTTTNATNVESTQASTGGGKVLGATTLAKTGVFQEMFANMSMLSGAIMIGLGSIVYGKKNQ